MSIRSAAQLRIPLACGLLLGVLGAPAKAVDGVLEINQTCAVLTGCFTGDAAGFPVEITQGGSYRLTGELSAGSTAVEVAAEHVTLDLNGFRIAGAGSPGSYGVHASQIGPGPDYVAVRNGSVTGFEVGIGAESFGRIEGVFVSECTTGISVGPDTAVQGSTIAENSGTGIAGPAMIQGNVLASNGVNLSGAFSNMGGNLCDGESCAAPPMRRYYLAPASFQGDQALSACAAGFHMASLWEIHEPSQLRYDTLRGQLAPDGGAGPPSAGCGTGCYGWVRTGSAAGSGPFPGDKNCNAWTSSSSGIEGVAAYLLDEWDSTLENPIAPWIGAPLPCDWTIGVWCMQD